LLGEVVARHLDDGALGAGVVNEIAALGGGGHEGGEGEVVEGAWEAVGGLVEAGCGVVGEQGLGAAGDGQLVFDVLFRARCYADRCPGNGLR